MILAFDEAFRAALDAARKAASPEENPPQVVRAYGGELLPSRRHLFTELSGLLVQFEDADLGAEDMGASLLVGELVGSVFCMAQNAQSPAAAAADGIRLAQWTVETLKGLDIALPGQLLLLRRLRVRRMLQDGNLYAALVQAIYDVS